MTKHMDPETAGRVHAVVLDVMAAFRKAVELYWHTPELIAAAGFASFEDWVRAQPKPQLTQRERKALAAEYVVELGMTQREAAAALGVSIDTVQRDAANAVSGDPVHDDEASGDTANAVTEPTSDRKRKDAEAAEEWDQAVDALQTPESRRKADVLRFEAALYGASEALDRIDPPLRHDEAEMLSITAAAIVRRLNRGHPKMEVVS